MHFISRHAKKLDAYTTTSCIHTCRHGWPNARRIMEYIRGRRQKTDLSVEIFLSRALYTLYDAGKNSEEECVKERERRRWGWVVDGAIYRERRCSKHKSAQERERAIQEIVSTRYQCARFCKTIGNLLLLRRGTMRESSARGY